MHDLLALDELTANSSILEFLNQEQRCLLTDTARTMSSASDSLTTSGAPRIGLTIDGGNMNDDDADDDDNSELDIESIIEEIQRLSGGTSRSGSGRRCVRRRDGGGDDLGVPMPDRSLEEILREAEELIGKQQQDAATAAAASRRQHQQQQQRQQNILMRSASARRASMRSPSMVVLSSARSTTSMATAGNCVQVSGLLVNCMLFLL